MHEAEPMPEMPMYPGGSNIHANNMVELTNPENSITLLKEALRGKRFMNGVEVKFNEPLLNDIGVASVVSQLRSLVNQVAILSFLEEQDIRMLVHDQFGRTLIQDLMLNRKKYKIIDASARSKIVSMSQSIAYNTLKRALKGNDKNFWSRITMDFSTNVQGGKEDSGLLSKVNMFKNR